MFGLRRARKDVCLRCRYHLTLQSFAQARQRGSRHLNSSTKSRSQATDESYTIDRSDTESPRTHANRFRVGALRQDQQHGRIAIKRLALNKNKVELQEVKSLGAPASILRFNPNDRDVQREQLQKLWAPRARGKNGPDQEGQSQQMPLTPSDVLSSELLQAWKDGRQGLLEDEIIPAVDSVRDRWLAEINPRDYLTPAQCAEVCKRLARSFTQAQLKLYLAATESRTAEDFDDLQGFYGTDWCIRSPWYSGELPQRAPGSIIEAYLRDQAPSHPTLFSGNAEHQSSGEMDEEAGGKTRKTKLVDRILRDSWHLRTFEELQSVGEVDVRLEPRRRTLLQHLHAFDDLERRLDVKVSIGDRNGALRIRGTHEACVLAFTGIYAPLQTFQRRQINLIGMAGGKRTWDDLLERNPHLLTSIGSASKVYIEPSSNEKLLLNVFFLSPTQSNNAIKESVTFDSALRMFKGINEAAHQPLFMLRAATEQTGYVPLKIADSVPLQLRQQNWSRRTNLNSRAARPLTKSDLETRNCTKLILSLSDQLIEASNEHQRIPTTDAPLSRYWQREPSRELQLQTGFAAFTPPTKQLSTLDGATDPKSAELRTFAFSVPGGLTSLEHLLDSSQTVDDCIVLRLEPQRIQPNKKRWRETILPSLEIRLTPDRSERGFHSASPTFSLSNSRIQLAVPAARSDALISSSTVVGAHEEMDTDIQEWVGKIVAVDGNILENTISGTLELDVPLQATRARPDFMKEIDNFIQDRKSRGLSTMFRQGSENASSPTAPDDTNMRRAQASDLLITSDDTEYYLSTQPLTNPMTSGKADEEYETSFLDPYEDTEDASPVDDKLDDAFENISRSHVPEKRPLGPRGRLVNFEADPQEPPADANSLFGKDMKYRGALLLDATVRATYQFVRLEYQSNMHAKYQGYDLTYSIVDAGDDGGRFEKLLLKAPGLEKSASEENDAAATEGVDSKQAADTEKSLRQQRRDQVIHTDPAFISFKNNKETHELADWLEKALGMIVKLNGHASEASPSSPEQTKRGKRRAPAAKPHTLDVNHNVS